jgi:hypothetical protein
MKVSRAMPLTARILRERKKCGLIVRARAMAVTDGWSGVLYSEYRNIPQGNVAIFEWLNPRHFSA